MEWWNALSDNKKYAVIVIVIVVVVLLSWLLIYRRGGVSPGGNVGGAPGQPGQPTTPQGPVTRQPVPSGTAVPGTSTVNLPASVAKPQFVAPAAPNTSANFRSFNITVSNNTFSPNTVIVNVGDTIHLNITAADKDYDFTQPDYGFKVPLPKGQTKVVEFQATAADKYTFFCKSCGGPNSGPVGYVIVVAK